MTGNILRKNRNIDIVFCIDGTGSMGKCIESVKSNAIRFHSEFVAAMTMRNSDIDSMRIKVIVFRDYKGDGDQSMVESIFYELPTDNAEFSDFMAGVTACGGGDAPENGLEAIHLAINSDFTTGPDDRQVIVVFTDADALPLLDPERTSNPIYPSDMVNFDDLQKEWMCAVQNSGFKLRERCKRMVIFAPDGTVYKDLSTKLNRSIFEPVDMNAGLKDIDFSEIINIIAASASGV